jgi:hypothetical protein
MRNEKMPIMSEEEKRLEEWKRRALATSNICLETLALKKSGDPHFLLLRTIGRPCPDAYFIGKQDLFLLHLTMEPKEIYPFSSVLYHVTSGLALRALMEGRAVLPLALHQSESIITHFGPFLDFGMMLLYFFGGYLKNSLLVGGAPLGVWLAPQVDPEEIKWEFNSERIPTVEDLNNQFSNLIEELTKHSHAGTDDEGLLLKLVSDLISILIKSLGIRGFWLNALSRVITDKVKRDEIIKENGGNYSYFLGALITHLSTMIQYVGESFKNRRVEKDDNNVWAFPVILVVNPDKLFGHLPYPVFLTPRNPHTIVPAFALTKGDICGVSFPSGVNPSVYDEIFRWLKDNNLPIIDYKGIPKLPSKSPPSLGFSDSWSPEADLAGNIFYLLSDRAPPSCIRRYSGDNLSCNVGLDYLHQMTSEIWGEPFSEGKLAPVMSMGLGPPLLQLGGGMGSYQEIFGSKNMPNLLKLPEGPGARRLINGVVLPGVVC